MESGGVVVQHGHVLSVLSVLWHWRCGSWRRRGGLARPGSCEQRALCLSKVLVEVLLACPAEARQSV